VKIRLLAIAALVIRIVFLVFYRIDSDEPQHLHIVWGWSRGLVQYRDVFDNHFPLLHLLFAPLMRLMPESSSTFLWMRLAIAPVAVACAWLVYVIGKPRIGARNAAFAAILFSVMPPWLAKSVEFRNDTLWIFFWLAFVAASGGGQAPAPVRTGGAPILHWIAGICASLSLLSSAKAAPLLIAHALAYLSERHSIEWKPALRLAFGAAIPAIAASAFLYARGALDDMIYATMLYNASLPVVAARRVGGALAFVVIAPALALRAPRGGHLTFVAIWYTILLLCFWPLITPRDFLPLVPLAALAIAPIAPVLLFIAATLASVWYARLWRPADTTPNQFVDAVATITTRDDFVFDLKGESVFRRRPVHVIYETVGRALTGNGTLADRGPEEIVAHRCCVAVPDATHIPARTRAFLNAHFLDAGALRVCGSIVRDGAFTIAVPQTYDVVARDRSRVVIDGVPYRGPRFLAAGTHTLVSPEENVRVMWSSVR